MSPDRLKRLGYTVTFVLSMAFFIASLSPTIYWRDSSEFVTVVHGLGISHPAGSPTYSLLAKPLTFLPIGSIALRVNLFSALMAALTVSCLFVLLYERLPASASWMRLFGALAGAAALTVSESFWRFAEVAEVYSMQNAVLVGLMLLLLRARDRGRWHGTPAVHLYCLFAFLYGLSAGIHVTMALFAPAFLIFIACTAPRMLVGKGLAYLAFFCLLGLSVYLYLPLRSLSNPAFDWSDPQTWSQFVIHLLDKKDAPGHWTFSWVMLPNQMHHYLGLLMHEFTLLGLVFGIIGCVQFFAHDRLLGCFLGLVFLGNVVFFIRIWTVAFGYIPSFVIFAIWVGMGIHWSLVRLTSLYARRLSPLPRRLAQAAVVAAVVSMLGVSGVQHAAEARQTNNYSAELYGRQLLDQLPPRAILLANYSWFLTQYLQHVERRRPDATVILQQAILQPHLYTALSKQQFPGIRLSDQAAPHAMDVSDYFWYFLKLNAPHHAMYMEATDHDRVAFPHLLPVGTLYRVFPDQEVELTPQLLDRHWALMRTTAERLLQGRLDTESRQFFLSRLVYAGRYFQHRERFEEAQKTYEFARTIQPDHYHLLLDYGTLLVMQQRYHEALQQFQAAYHANPKGSTAHKMLGTYFLEMGRLQDAVYFLERARRLGYETGELYTVLAETYARLGRYERMKGALQEALGRFREETETQTEPPDMFLPQKLAWVQENLQRLDQGATDQLLPLQLLWESSQLPSYTSGR